MIQVSWLMVATIVVIFFVLYYDYCKVHDFLKSITQVIVVYNNFIGNTSYLLENIGETDL